MDSDSDRELSPRDLIHGRKTYRRECADFGRSSPLHQQQGRTTPLPFEQRAHDSASSGDEVGDDGDEVDEGYAEFAQFPNGHTHVAADWVPRPRSAYPEPDSCSPGEEQSFPLIPSWWIYFLVGIIAAHVTLGYIDRGAGEAPAAPEDSFEIPESCLSGLKTLKDEYPEQDEAFWPSLEYNLWNVLKDPPRPSIITFLYNESTSTVLLDRIVGATHECMHPETEPIVVNQGTFSEPKVDFGIIIDKYKEELRRSRVMMVQNIQDISGIASRAFHDLCDSYNPIIDRYVVYFSLFYTQADWQEFPNPNDLASDLLKRRWDDEISADTAAALIARVTEAVLVLRKTIY